MGPKGQITPRHKASLQEPGRSGQRKAEQEQMPKKETRPYITKWPLAKGLPNATATPKALSTRAMVWFGPDSAWFIRRTNINRHAKQSKLRAVTAQRAIPYHRSASTFQSFDVSTPSLPAARFRIISNIFFAVSPVAGTLFASGSSTSSGGNSRRNRDG